MLAEETRGLEKALAATTWRWEQHGLTVSEKSLSLRSVARTHAGSMGGGEGGQDMLVADEDDSCDHQEVGTVWWWGVSKQALAAIGEEDTCWLQKSWSVGGQGG